MPRDLFGVGATPTALKRPFSKYTVLGSALMHVAMLAIVLIVPLLADDVLPAPHGERETFINAVPVPPNPPAPAPTQPVRIDRASVVNHDAAPIVSPPDIRPEDPAPSGNIADGGLDLGPAVSSFDTGLDIGGPMIMAPPAPVPAPRPGPHGPLRLGGAIRPPVRINYVAPVYPQIALAARVQGTVNIDAIIGTDGVVQQARIVSGNPLLNDAALNAVKQWRYTSALLNNQPVAVIMTVAVTFNLQH